MAARKLTIIELAPIVADYLSAFPGWQLIGDDVLIRFDGPVAQAIWFDRLRTGAYRPTCRVHVLAAPTDEGGTVVLPQFLNIKVREITLNAHPKALSTVVTALKSEILPSPGKALDARAVAQLLRDRSSGRPSNAYALACLLGALGDSEGAALWIREYHNAVTNLGLAPQPLDEERDAFLKKVEEWLKLSENEAQFAEIVKQQISRLLQKK